MSEPSISVVIPVHNEADQIRPTVSNVLATRATHDPIEVIVVDDASTDCGCDSLSDEWPAPVRVIRLQSRVGVARARNSGAAVASGEILFMTDAHVRLEWGWDATTLARVSGERVHAATIVDPTSRFRGHGCTLSVPFMGTKWNRHGLAAGDAVQVPSCAGTVLRREVFDRIGGYDAGMMIYGAAEPEFGVRAWLSGFEVVSQPDLRVLHRFKSRAGVDYFFTEMRPLLIHNALRFGLLYLDTVLGLEMLRLYALRFPKQFMRGFSLAYESDVWERRDYLEATLVHDFSWFAKRFDLKDSAGGRLHGDWRSSASAMALDNRQRLMRAVIDDA